MEKKPWHKTKMTPAQARCLWFPQLLSPSGHAMTSRRVCSKQERGPPSPPATAVHHGQHLPAGPFTVLLDCVRVY